MAKLSTSQLRDIIDKSRCPADIAEAQAEMSQRDRDLYAMRGDIASRAGTIPLGTSGWFV